MSILTRSKPYAITLTFLIGMMISGCSATIEDYQDETPRLDMASYFNGPLQAWGMFQNRSGKVIKRFEVQMHGQWQGNQGILDEHFTYADGTTQRRVWTLKKLDQNRFSGTADDVVGEATGVAYGNALYWTYTMALEVDGKTYHVDFDDWMYMIDQHTVINRSVMKKLGFTLGEVTLVFRRLRT
jgi:hypothetical protein